MNKPAPRKIIQFSQLAKQTEDSNTTLLYGESGTGKTRECEAYIRYIWNKYRLKTRYITIDGGSIQAIKPLAEAGMVDVVDLAPAGSNAIVTVRGIMQGMWLEDGAWVPPSKQKTVSEVGCYIFETLSTYSTTIMQYFIENNVAASEELIAYSELSNDDPELKALIGSQTIGTLSRAHYGMLARELTLFVQRMNALQGTLGLKRILYTSHDGSGENEKIKGVKLITMGPGGEGQKFSKDLPKMVGDMIYMTKATVGNKVEYRAAFQPYPDPQLGNRPWPATMRGSAEVMDKLLKVPGLEKGYIVLTNEDDPVNRRGITRLFDERDAIETNAVERLKTLMQQQPTKE